MRIFKPYIGAFAGACLLSSITTAFAFDSNAYTGTWQSQAPAVMLEIGMDNASIHLDGTAHTDNDLQLLPSKLGSTPFLYLDARHESGQQEYHFYLIRSTDAQENPTLNGYYDQVSLDKDGNKLTTQSFPLTMEQTQQQLSAAK